MHSQSWQTALSNAVTDLPTLLQLLQLEDQMPVDQQAMLAAKQFSLRVPHELIARMKPGDLKDPLLQQVLPLGIEMSTVPGYTQHPLDEQQFNPVPGLLHKYANRVLLTLAGSCAINCRYCFRRHFPYEQNNPGMRGWQQAIDYIAQHEGIDEVIFSGGDPLLVKDAQLQQLVLQLAAIPHLKRLRIHTRLPIVIPQRINDTLLQWLTQTRLQPIVVVHCNHPNEIDHTVIAAFKKLQQANITLLNQSVLLKGINDNATTLCDLSRQLFAAGVMPYYLHLLDKVQGAAHFDIPKQQAQHIIQTMRERLSGYLVPQLVCEEPGEAAKTLIHAE